MRSISSLFHSSTAASLRTDGEMPHAPATESKKSRSLFSLSGLKSRVSKLGAAPAAGSSMPPRSALKPKPIPANALGRLMHDERPTALTTAFLEQAEARTTRAPKSVKFVEHALIQDGAGKLEKVASKRFSTHALAEPSPESRRTSQERTAMAKDAAVKLDDLVKNHPGSFDAQVQQGIVPEEALAGVDLSKVEPFDIIHTFQDRQRVAHHLLLRDIAQTLKQLGASSPEAAMELLHNIMRNPHLEFDSESGEIDEASPADRIRTAFANLPERLRGDDVAEAFESIGKLHPAQLFEAKEQAYKDTIGARLAQLNSNEN